MANLSELSQDAANVAADAVCSRLNGGNLEVYSRSGALMAKTLFADKAFTPAEGGAAVASEFMPAEVEAAGIASSYKAITDAGVLMFSGNVGMADESCVLDTTKLQPGDEIIVSRLTYKHRIK